MRAFFAFKKKWKNYQNYTLFESEPQRQRYFHVLDEIKVSREPL